MTFINVRTHASPQLARHPVGTAVPLADFVDYVARVVHTTDDWNMRSLQQQHLSPSSPNQSQIEQRTAQQSPGFAPAELRGEDRGGSAGSSDDTGGAESGSAAAGESPPSRSASLSQSLNPTAAEMFLQDSHAYNRALRQIVFHSRSPGDLLQPDANFSIQLQLTPAAHNPAFMKLLEEPLPNDRCYLSYFD